LVPGESLRRRSRRRQTLSFLNAWQVSHFKKPIAPNVSHLREGSSSI
jgi:hypothetical protein